MCGPIFLMFMANLAAIVLLYVLSMRTRVYYLLNMLPNRVVVTFSTPFIRAFYFLRTDFAGGIKFGLLGFCNDLTGTCTAKAFVVPIIRSLRTLTLCIRLGYHHEPQITNPLTTVLVLYPVGECSVD